MKHFTYLLLSLCILFSLNSTAQTQDSTIAIPNGSFENWSTGSGYSVTVVFVPLSVYSSFPYPTGWDYPTYPVNENISYMNMNVNVNTNLPLLKASNDASGVVDGSYALKIQSFKLSDIISSLVYSLAESSLDPTLTATVFPTALSTGVVDIDEFLPLLFDITGNMDSLPQLMSIVSDLDLNTIITGGVPLNGAIPDRLTGYYKYTSAIGGDNGGILILGSKYNTTTHKREVVGGGYNISLTDTSSYTPFEVPYTPLSEIYPTSPYVEADSIVIILFSSANENPQQGSALYLDHLQLLAQSGETPEDTCSAVFNLTVQGVDTTHATLNWTYEGAPDHFEVEYGVQGFTLGNGTPVNVNSNSLTLSDLIPDTYYDVYVRCVCSSTLWGEWALTTFHTDTLPVIDTCSAIFDLTVHNVDTMHAMLSWTYEGDPDHFEAEYGIQGFALGSGTPVNAITNDLTLSDLEPDTYYDVYVRCVCDDELWGEWTMTTFHTDTLVPPVIIDDSTGIQNFTAGNLLVYPNPAKGQCMVRFSEEMPAVVRLYTIEGVLVKEIIPETETIELILPTKGVFFLCCEMKAGTAVQKIVNQ